MSSTQTAPLYVTYAQQIRAMIAEQGLPQPAYHNTPSTFHENAGWFFVRWTESPEAASLIVPKSVTRMGNLHSHIDLSALDGAIPLSKRNGRVVCHFTPDASKVSRALGLFVAASKRPVAPPVRRLAADSRVASQAPAGATPSAVRVGTMADLTAGLPTAGETEVASWGDYSEEDAEEALQSLGTL